MTSYGYDDANRLNSVSLPNGVTSSYQYDPAGHLTELKHSTSGATLADYSYTYDALGNRLTQKESLAAPAGSAVQSQWFKISVLDSAGAPAVGALVLAADGSGQTLTDSQGSALLWLDNTRVQVVYNGEVLTSGTISGDTTINLPDLAHTIDYVVDNADQPVANVPLYLYAGEVYTGQTAATDAGGKATFNAELNGGYLYRVKAPDGAPATSPVTVTVVAADNAPLSGVDVMATTGTGFNHQNDSVPTGIHGTTDANGQVTLSLPVGIDYKFRLKTNGLQVYTGSEVCTPQAGGAGCAAQTITLETLRQVSLALTGENGAPLANRPVYATSSHSYAGTQVTGADGKAVFTLPVSGIVGNNTANLSYTFSAYSAGGLPVSSAACAPFHDSATPGCDSAAIAFQALSPVAVSVTGGTASTRVFVYSGTDYASKAYTGINGVTDSSGSTTFNLPQGNYWFGALENGTYSMQTDSQVCSLPGCSAASLALGTVEGGTVQIAYSYDKLSRLTAADYSNGLFFHYTFDAVGNRLSQTTKDSTVNSTYDSANRLTSVGGQAYTWDDNGNLLNDGTTTYSYTSDKLSSMTRAGQNISFKYNGLGDRLQQIVNGTTTNYTLDINSGLTQALQDGTNTYLYGNGRISQVAATQTGYFLPDSMDSVRQIVDGTGALQLAQSFDPYGNVISSSGSGKTIFGYDGEMVDAAGLVNLRARDYSSEIGRFLSKDTWQGDYNLPESYNAWLFGYADPVNISDPSGLCGADWGWGADERTKDCITLANALEKTYGVIIYWPGKANLPEGVPDNIGCLCGENNQFCEGVNPDYKRWTLNEMTAIAVSINLHQAELNFNATKSMLQGVVFGRSNGNRALKIDSDVDGLYFSSLPGFNKPGILQFDTYFWGDYVDTFTHEIAHREMDWYDNVLMHHPDFAENDFKNIVWNGDQNPQTGPTDYARKSNVKEDIAETITTYLWDRHMNDWISLLPFPGNITHGYMQRRANYDLTQNRVEFAESFFKAVRQLVP